MGVTPRLIKSIVTIKNLKSSTISYEFNKSRFGSYDFDLISDFFSVIPKLENLSFHVGQLLEDPVLKPLALSNLHYLSFTYDKNSEGIGKISQCSENTLKIVQLCSADKELEGLYRFFEPIKDTLEALFTI